MTKILEKQLKTLGFKDSEVTVYLYLLENGLSTPSEISKGANILRTNTYSILDDLSDKGLVEIQKQNNKNVYVAKNPKALLDMIEQKREMVASDLLPDLVSMFKSQKNKPVVKFYEGKENIEEVFKEMYEAETIYGITSTEKLFKHFGPFLAKWRSELITRRIFLKDILTESSRAITEEETKKDLDVYLDYRFLPEKHNDLSVDILTWNDKIAIFTTVEPFVGTLIKHKDIANAFKMMHTVMWSGLKK